VETGTHITWLQSERFMLITGSCLVPVANLANFCVVTVDETVYISWAKLLCQTNPFGMRCSNIVYIRAVSITS
jgi:hypothetical protein